MNTNRAFPSPRRVALVAMLCLAASAHAEVGGFAPKPRTAAQVVQAAGDRTIVSASGTAIEAGASFEQVSNKRAWLAVSIRNKGAAPLAVGDDAVRVTAAGKALSIEDVTDPKSDEAPGVDTCASASKTSQVNCGIDRFNARQKDRVGEADDASLAPGEVQARQFEVTLPKAWQTTPAKITVSVVVAGEALEFDFERAE
jgi:hypothetical protein